MTSSTKRKRKGKTRRQQIQARRGRRLVIAALTASVVYCAILLYFTLAGYRWGSGFSSTHLVASLIVGAVFVIGTSLAVCAFRGNPVLRQLYLALNFVGALVGTLSVGYRLAQGIAGEWVYFDLVGVGMAFFVCWIFLGAKSGQAFLQDQVFNVKRT